MLSDDGTWADIHVHGGPWVVQATLELLAREGFDIVGPSEEPPLWAVDGETILDREISAALPLARTELAVRALLSQRQAWDDLRSKIKDQKSKIDEILADHSLYCLLHPPAVAIVGVPNAGKSTLANQLFAQERSITADVPGTTRDWVGELANIDGLAVMLLDTPGLRSTTNAIEKKAIEQSRPVIERAGLVILVLDCSIPLPGEQQQLLDRFPKAIRIANKSDRACLWDAGALGAIPTVAKDGKGIDDLRKAIQRHFNCANLDLARPRIWTQRQRDELMKHAT